MAQLMQGGNTFDATTVEPATGGISAKPPGVYNVMITDSEDKPTKNFDSTGNTFLQLSLTIIDDGPYKGEFFIHRLNLNNQNQQAVDIARRELSAICHAIGVLQPRDSQELHNRPLTITVAMDKNEGKYNEVKKFEQYKPQGITGTAPAPQQQAAPVAQQPYQQSQQAAQPVQQQAPAQMPWQ